MSDFQLYIGYRHTSSWSLRGWLMMRKAGAPFEEMMIRYRLADHKARLSAVSPTSKVPLLVDRRGAEEVKVWDSLAIGEYLAEAFPASRSVSRTSIGVFVRSRAGSGETNDLRIEQGLKRISKRRPAWRRGGSIDMHSWYWGSLATHQVGEQPLVQTHLREQFCLNHGLLRHRQQHQGHESSSIHRGRFVDALHDAIT